MDNKNKKQEEEGIKITDLDLELFGATIEIENLEAVLICSIVGIIATILMTNIGIKQVSTDYKGCIEKLPKDIDKETMNANCPNLKTKWIFTKILGIILVFPVSIYAVRIMSNR